MTAKKKPVVREGSATLLYKVVIIVNKDILHISKQLKLWNFNILTITKVEKVF